MADKDLLGIIADILRKLDQHSQELKEQGNRLEVHSEALKKQGEVLTAFMEGALKQFDQQLIINDKLVNRLENLESRFNSN
ncbi:MAG: hypothetical protein EOP42_06585 [Sphingobacteriaceae bacterium]|nr:MAG: hypothetical protein EOP42_06585 [Sphingobacteriaceae bacterium]